MTTTKSPQLFKTPTKTELYAAVRWQARRRLIDFSIATDRNYRASWHHKLIAEKLEAVERGEIKRLMLFMPPRHGKSQLATINFPAWFLGRNSNKEIITASYSGDLAQEFGGKTRDIIADPAYPFDNLRLKEDEKARGRWRTVAPGRYQGAYTAVGVGGAITGRGAHILLIDDPIKNREEADSQVYRDKVWSWYLSTAFTRLEPQGAVIVILTRWHLDDLAGRLLKQSDEWDVVNLPAIAIQDEPHRRKGEALWPDRYSLDVLNNIKATLGPYEWSALYQQNPILSENQELKPHWIKKITFEEVKKLDARIFVTVDTAISERAENDSTGICVNYVDRENKWNLRAGRLRVDPKQLLDILFQMFANEPIEKIGIEKTVYFSAIKPFLDDEQRRRNVFLPIVPLEHHQVNKHTRIRGLIPRYSSFSVRHIVGECDDLEEEMFAFPVGANDDVLDATAYQLQIAEAPYGLQSNRKREAAKDTTVV